MISSNSINEGKVLIDTGAWVDFLSNSNGKPGDLVALAIERDQALICGIVIAELLQGAATAKEQQQLKLLFSTIRSLPTTEVVMLSAGTLMQKLRIRNINVALTDAIIAATALEYKVPLLTLDESFSHFPDLTLLS